MRNNDISFEEFIRQLELECRNEYNKSDYAKCCDKPESKCTETQPDFDAIAAREAAKKQQEYIAIGVILLLLLAIVAVIRLFVKKGYYSKYVKPHNRTILMICTGWLIWALCIFSYNELFRDHLDYATWLSLPVICILAMYLWLRVFVLKRP